MTKYRIIEEVGVNNTPLFWPQAKRGFFGLWEHVEEPYGDFILEAYKAIQKDHAVRESGFRRAINITYL
jgi:hypothetical protein